MEKQYLGIKDPAAIINALVAQINTLEAQLGYESGEKTKLMAEVATLRDELQKERLPL